MFNALYHLFFGKPINFYSPYTLNETAKRLRDASERDKRKPTIWCFIWILFTGKGRNFKLIKLETINLQSYRFHVTRDVDKSTRINTHGEVQEDNSGVRVTGFVQINLVSRFLMLFWLVLWIAIAILLIFFTTQSPFRFFPFLYVLMGIGIVLSNKHDQNKMYNQIHETLGKSKKKNYSDYMQSRLSIKNCRITCAK
jgi:hypothetical protein